jgi:hypothetical protein
VTALNLTDKEQAAVRTALQFLRGTIGGYTKLGRVLRLDHSTLIHAANGRRQITPLITFRIARAVGVGIDDLLAGKFPPVGTCPKCGHVETQP